MSGTAGHRQGEVPRSGRTGPAGRGLLPAGLLLLSVSAVGASFLPGCRSGAQRGRLISDSQSVPEKVSPAGDLDPAKAYLPLGEVPPPVSLDPLNPRAATEASVATLRRMNSARELVAEQRYTEAISELEKALRYDPRYGPLYRLLGVACRRSGALGRAASFLDKALLLDPADLVGHYHRAMVASEDGAEETALRHLRLAWACPPREEDRICRALVALELAERLEAGGYLAAAAELYGRFENVRVEWDQSELTDPEEVELVSTGPEVAALRIGRIRERLGRLDQAARAYQRALQYAPTDVVVQTGNARLLMRLGRHAEARELTRKLLGAAASDREWNEVRALYLERGHGQDLTDDLKIVAAGPAPSVRVLEALLDLLGKRGDPAEAEAILRKLIEARGGDRASYVRALEYFASRGQGDRAVRLLSEVSSDHPERLASLEQAVDQLGAKGQYAGTVLEAGGATLDQSVPASSRDAALWYLVARLAAGSGAEERARGWLEELVRVRPEFISAYPLLGDLYVRQGRWRQAIDLIQQGLQPEEAAARNAEAQLVLARAHEGLDEYARAEECFEAAAALRRDDPGPAYELGQLLERRGELLRARRQYQAALAADPSHAGAHEALMRNFLLQQETRLAQDQLRDMKRALGGGAALERCQALWDYYDQVRTSRRARRQITLDYVDRLQALADRDRSDVATRLDLSSALCEPLRQYDRAARVLDETLALEPYNQQALELRVRVHRRKLEFEQAAELLNRMLERHPNREAWMWRQAQVYLTLQDYDSAMALFRKLLGRSEPGAESGGLRRALLGALVRADRFAEAADTVRAWEDQYMERSETDQIPVFGWRSTLIEKLLDASANDLALELAEEWYEEAPGDPAARRALIAALASPAGLGPPGTEAKPSAERMERGKLLLLQWLEEDPDNNELNRLLLALLAVQDKHRATVELARNWVAAANRRNRPWKVLAGALMGAKEFDEAIRLYKREARRSGDLTDFQRTAQAMIQARRHDEAERYLLNLQERARGGPVQRSALAYSLYGCYLDWGKNALAERQLEQILEDTEELSYEPGAGLQDLYFGVCNDLGYFWTEQGKDLERAEQMIRQAVSQAPRREAYLDSLGWVRYKRGDLGGALKWLERAARAGRHRDAVILEHLGDTCWRLGRRDEAVEFWRQAVGLLEPQAQRDELSPDETRSYQGIIRRLEQFERGEEPAIAEIAERPADAAH